MTIGIDKHTREEGTTFAPRFDRDGLITCVTIADDDGAVLMVAHMNEEALRLTLETGIAHYWSRSRETLWRKGDTSGQTQQVVEIRTDCDQDALVMRVVAGGRWRCLSHRPPLLLLPDRQGGWRRRGSRIRLIENARSRNA